jgi:hypothetical protein
LILNKSNPDSGGTEEVHRSSTFLSALFLVEFLLDVLMKVCWVPFFRKRCVDNCVELSGEIVPKVTRLRFLFLTTGKKFRRKKERTDFEIFWQLNITRARGLGHVPVNSVTLAVATHKSREPKRKDQIRKKKANGSVTRAPCQQFLRWVPCWFSEPLEKERKDVVNRELYTHVVLPYFFRSSIRLVWPRLFPGMPAVLFQKRKQTSNKTVEPTAAAVAVDPQFHSKIYI